jgi:CRP-like cAMP-binding protein
MTYHGDEAFGALSDEQWARPQACGSAQEVESGALLSGAGEAAYDLILVDSGEAGVVRAATAQAAGAVVARFGTGQFVAELSLLTGQATLLRVLYRSSSRAQLAAGRQRAFHCKGSGMPEGSRRCPFRGLPESPAAARPTCG